MKDDSAVYLLLDDATNAGMQRGRREGRQEGKRDGMRTMALRMLEDGSVTIEYISMITGFSVEGIQKLDAEQRKKPGKASLFSITDRKRPKT